LNDMCGEEMKAAAKQTDATVFKIFALDGRIRYVGIADTAYQLPSVSAHVCFSSQNHEA